MSRSYPEAVGKQSIATESFIRVDMNKRIATDEKGNTSWREVRISGKSIMLCQWSCDWNKSIDYANRFYMITIDLTTGELSGEHHYGKIDDKNETDSNINGQCEKR